MERLQYAHPFSRILLLAACLLILTACGQFEAVESEEKGDSYTTGITKAKNPVYTVQALELEDAPAAALYAATYPLPEDFQNAVEWFLQEDPYGVYKGLTPGPAIAKFQHEELYSDPDGKGVLLGRFLVPLVDAESGKCKYILELASLGGEVCEPHIDASDAYRQALACIAHLTSPETPLYLALNGSHFYYIIGDIAYTFDGTPGLQYLPELVTDGFDIEVAELHFG